MLLLAVLLGAYTGFLLSALKTYPLLNNPVLPVLFLISGVSSGIASTILLAVTLFKENHHSQGVSFVHRFERPVLAVEVLLLVCFFTGLYFGGGQKEARAAAGQKRLSGAGLQPDSGGDPAAALLRALRRPDDGSLKV